jgi:hypothetical protein
MTMPPENKSTIGYCSPFVVVDGAHHRWGCPTDLRMHLGPAVLSQREWHDEKFPVPKLTPVLDQGSDRAKISALLPENRPSQAVLTATLKR